MTCVNVGAAIVCRPDDRFLRKEVHRCPICECQTEMAVRYAAWHGTSAYCCRCGDARDEGQLRPRPFVRGWRTRAVRRHRAMWDRASHGPPPAASELYPDLFDEEE